ncbi:MAG TPA: MBL fold metallo-hydrolase [Candidatus Omnitrophota bacterium]|nr:MBL fold metallo-hydrolase [Candidatus Omnitrophota bacterium]
MFQLLKVHLDENNPETWENLIKLPESTRKEWLLKHAKDIVRTLESSRNAAAWKDIGQTMINLNLYHEAEALFDQMFHLMQRSHGDFGTPAYLRGISRFLQGRFKEASEDFKLARQHDLHMRIPNSPSARAIAYMEETIFPTREIIRKNHDKLIRDLNLERQLDYKVGANVLKTLHKWNSASPLYSRGLSQGGGYFLTLRSARGDAKGIAIDPGYDFFNILRDTGLGIADLDAIIITHDHDDHTESVESILSLLAKYNDYNKEKRSKVLDIFGSAGVLLKFHGLLSATDPMGNKEINFNLLVPGNRIRQSGGSLLMDKYGFNLRVNPAFHTELWTGQESAVGVVIETNLTDRNDEMLNIGITGDTRYVEGHGKHYTDCQVILLNIGSIEKEEGKFLSQHLGMLGCINLLKEARLHKPALAVLTEFGEEFSGKRDTISRIIENWAQPLNGGSASRDLRVIPADINLEIKLHDLSIRESDTNVFFPYRKIEVDESDPGLLKYRFNG